MRLASCLAAFWNTLGICCCSDSVHRAYCLERAPVVDGGGRDRIQLTEAAERCLARYFVQGICNNNLFQQALRRALWQRLSQFL